jgi:hypothetical protein
MSLRHLVSIPCVALALAALPASAESVEPQKGQTPEQMQKDISECQATAKQSSGYDPAAASTDAPDERQAGGRVKGAAKGAAAGAAAAGVRGRQYDAYEDVSDDAKQEYRQENAKDAAAAGAAIGASRQRQDRREDRRADKDKEKSANDYHQSYQGCLSSRGYKVTP